MEGKFKIRVIDVMVLAGIASLVAFYSANRPAEEASELSEFAAAVDLAPFDSVAVHAEGRLRSFESHTKYFMKLISGPKHVHDQPAAFTYLDLAFRPQRYADAELIYVKNKLVRERLLEKLEGHPDLTKDREKRMRDSGLFSPTLLNDPAVTAELQRMGRDTIRTEKAVSLIESAMAVSSPRFLRGMLRVIPPPSGELGDAWLTLDEAAGRMPMPEDGTHTGLASMQAIPGLDASLQDQMVENWNALQGAWRAENAKGVNESVAALAALFPEVAPEIYPSGGRLEWESWYFRSKSMTWVWLVYLLATMPLLMSVIYKWNRARTIGLVLFAIAFGLQTASLALRWYISGRWPNSNMFEAVTTTAWFGGVSAIVLEWVVRKTAFRNLFALGSAVISMVALMAAYFLPTQLDPTIGNKMAALNDVWLYIHTNVIIWSYGVIGLACIPALLMLRHRWCQLWDEGNVPKFRLVLLPIALGVLNYTAYALFMNAMDAPAWKLSSNSLLGTAGAFWGSLMIVILEGMAARDRRVAGITVERGASGGASALILGGSGGAGFMDDKPNATHVYDGATMVLVELSFIMLWAGLVMGAIWADHSWGRPWGWDPKETFALNTFLIFLVLVHVRLKVKDKAFWTAVLAVIGFEVMMFNWIVVNFVISGLHSYA